MMQFDNLSNLETPISVQHSLFYDWKHHLKLFGLGGTVKPGEEEGDGFND